MRRDSVVVPYSNDWPRLFAVEAELLERGLEPWLSGGIHHVGSTAVPGLAAKPIIDMLAGVRNLEEARAAFEPVARLGYVYREHRSEAHWFSKPTHNLHLTEPGSDLWRERLAFCDALRADRELANEYERWKLAHAAAPGETNAYTATKTPFVTRVLGQLGLEVKPDAERLSPSLDAESKVGRWID